MQLWDCLHCYGGGIVVGGAEGHYYILYYFCMHRAPQWQVKCDMIITHTHRCSTLGGGGVQHRDIHTLITNICRNSHVALLSFTQPSLFPLSTDKSAAKSPVDNRETRSEYLILTQGKVELLNISASTYEEHLRCQSSWQKTLGVRIHLRLS